MNRFHQDRIAFLFPGQGSQQIGMGRLAAEAWPEAAAVFETAGRVLGFDLAGLCFQGPGERLNRTEFTQPALLAASVAILRGIQREIPGLTADLVAGHSLGEYTALVAAGSLALEDAIRLVHRRGLFMQEAVPLGTGSMAAVIGLQTERLEAILREVPGVWVANYNSPEQVVIGGEKSAVAEALRRAADGGAKRTVPLAVSVPSHTPMMEPAAGKLALELKTISFTDPKIPLVNNVAAEVVRTAQEAREGVIRQLAAPLLWEKGIRRMREMGVGLFVEIGPGRVLCSLVKRIDRAAETASVSDPAGLAALKSLLREVRG